MARKVLVSLVSERTIPNVQLIKELKSEVDFFIFIISEKVKRQLSWIIKSCNVYENQYDIIVINPYDIDDIEKKLNEYSFKDDNYILNITGGTKLSTIVSYDKFKDLAADIYYIPGYKNEFIKIFPAKGNRKFVFKNSLSVEEYINSYGFDVKHKTQPLLGEHTIMSFFERYINNWESIKEILKKLQKFRGRKKIDIDDELEKLVALLDFKPKKNGVLFKDEIKFLTGEWFEEFMYFKVKKDFELNDDQIGLGWQVVSDKKVSNEFDVLWTYINKFYFLECKTSIFYDVYTKDGTKKEENLLRDVIYKNDSLKDNFGFFVTPILATLSELKDDRGNIKDKYRDHYLRAESYGVKIISKHNLLDKNFNLKEFITSKEN